jgi:mono/diheme cytochrome c family protein
VRRKNRLAGPLRPSTLARDALSYVEGRGTRPTYVLVLLLTAAPHAFAQQAPDTLNDQQRLGRQVLGQSCGVCHLPPARSARTYGPVLSKASGGGDDALVRKVILEGTPRMPAFKHFLQPSEIDAIIAFIRTVPTPAPAAAAPRGPASSSAVQE